MVATRNRTQSEFWNQGYTPCETAHPGVGLCQWRFLGKLANDPSGGGVMECGRMAVQAAGTVAAAGPVQFGVYKGNECYAADAKSTMYGISRNCNIRPDERGANTGGTQEFALYTLAPRGVVARYLRLIRRTVDPKRSGDLHVVGLVALTTGFQAVIPQGVRCMRGETQSLIPQQTEVGSDDSVSYFLQKLQTVGADLGRATTFLHLGPIRIHTSNQSKKIRGRCGV